MVVVRIKYVILLLAVWLALTCPDWELDYIEGDLYYTRGVTARRLSTTMPLWRVPT